MDFNNKTGKTVFLPKTRSENKKYGHQKIPATIYFIYILSKNP